MNQIELEQEIQRFAGEFISRVTSAAEPLTRRSELSRAALNRLVLYTSSALDIVSGPMPEVNLLDMMVFVRLSRSVFETHLLPNVFGEPGKPMLEALTVSEREIGALASRTLNQQELRQLEARTDSWLEEHPTNVNVEVVRFGEFAALAGELRGGEATGLLKSVKATVQAADQAILLGERALFFSQRMPFLLRLHARLAAQDLVVDTMLSMKANRLGWRLAGYLAAVGGAWAVSFLGAYALARRMAGRRREGLFAF